MTRGGRAAARHGGRRADSSGLGRRYAWTKTSRDGNTQDTWSLCQISTQSPTFPSDTPRRSLVYNSHRVPYHDLNKGRRSHEEMETGSRLILHGSPCLTVPLLLGYFNVPEGGHVACSLTENKNRAGRRGDGNGERALFSTLEC